MRKVVLDTETTGLEPAQGHRIIEIGGVELVDRRLTGERYHQYLCPDREVDAGALAVHGMDAAFLADKPRFADIAADFLRFVDDAELLIHNAPFDVAFLDSELARLDGPRARIQDHCRISDTLTLARRLHPGQKNSLDALCRRYAVENSGRELHGALLDAELLAEVYLAMTGGQASLDLDAGAFASPAGAGIATDGPVAHAPLKVIRASGEELEAHLQRLAAIDEMSGGRCVWKGLDEATE